MGWFDCICEIPLYKQNDTYYLNLTALITNSFPEIGKHLEDVRATEVQSIKTYIGDTAYKIKTSRIKLVT
jgi:hypothetical protein